MHIFHKTEEETERGEKKKPQPVCVVSVQLTSDLAEYDKEESAESTGCVRECMSACTCVFCGPYASSFLCGW